MLRSTRRDCVLFTQAFPLLERFASDHFLPSNPLSSSCIWLDEDDFRGVALTAKNHGVPNPLHIDPYAHHPVLSRFATKPAKDKHRKQRQACASAKSADVTGYANTPVEGEASDVKEEIKGLLQNSVTADAAARATQDSNQQTLSARRVKRGRLPQSDTLSAEPFSAESVAALDLSQYQVPICSMLITKPLYLLNLDQMYLSVQPCSAWGSGNTEDGTAGVRGPDTPPGFADFQSRSAKPALSRGDFGFNSLSNDEYEDATDPLLFPVLRGHDWMGVESGHLFAERGSEAELLGARELQRRYPNPAGVPAEAMYSIATRQKYGSKRQVELQRLAKRCSYQSRWWGTRKQWARVGALMQPGQAEHVVPVSYQSKLVHVSLLENAAEVLKNVLITSRFRKLIYLFELSHSESEKDIDSVMQKGVVARRSDSSVSFLSMFKEKENKCFYKRLSGLLKKDVEQMKYSVPLYLSKHQIISLGLSLRPDARGVGLQNDNSNAFTDESDDLDATKKEPGSVDKTETFKQSSTTYHYWYHISQAHFPESYLIPSAVLSAELDNPGVPLHGVTGARLPHRELTYASLVNHHPEVAALLLTDIKKNADVTSTGGVLNDSTEAQVHSHDQTRLSSINDSSAASVVEDNNTLIEAQKADSSLASDNVRAPATAPLDELSVTQFVATHASPKFVKGRHLWFKAEDVLAANGIVNVNSAPVEVRVDALLGKRFAGGLDAASVEETLLDENSSHVMYNVACLTDPDEALRKLSLPFEAI